MFMPVILLKLTISPFLATPPALLQRLYGVDAHPWLTAGWGGTYCVV